MSLSAAFARDKLPGVSPGIYSHADFAAISRIVHDEAGIVLPPGKAMLVYSRIAPLVRASGLGTFADYIGMARGDAGQLKSMIDALTTNHTFFYREAHHFLHFAEQVRPELAQRLLGGGEARLWSAGCSSGEETWSLVMTLLGENKQDGARLARSKVRVLASDLARHVLRRAADATYGAGDVESVPFVLRQNWLRSQGGEVSLAPEPRAVVRFRELNLLGEWPMRQTFDVIFCRNVMIYFDLPTKERLIERFAAQLVPGGHLYIGHSERVSGPAAGLLEPVGPTIYRRRKH